MKRRIFSEARLSHTAAMLLIFVALSGCKQRSSDVSLKGEAGSDPEFHLPPEPAVPTLTVLGIIDARPSGKAINNGGVCGVLINDRAQRDSRSSAGFEYHEVEVIENDGPVPNVYFRNSTSGGMLSIGNGMRVKGSTRANCPIATGGKDWIKNINRINDFIFTARMPGEKKPQETASASRPPSRTPSSSQRWFDCEYQCYCDSGFNYSIAKQGFSSSRACWEAAKNQCEGLRPFLQGACSLEGTIYSRSP